MTKSRRLKSISPEKHKQILLEILSFLDKTCKSLKIQYYLGCGSVLGAVRHKGMIPWDDDIDIFMMRSEYERFKIEYDNKNSLYKLYSYDINGYPIPYTKLSDERTCQIEELGAQLPTIGINIDIYPIDYVCGDISKFLHEKNSRKLLYDKLYNIYFPFFRKHSPFGYLKIIYYRLIYKRGLSICKKIDELAKSCSTEDSEYVFEQIQGIFGKRPFKKEWFDDYELIEFEGKSYPVMIGYIDYLKANYGDDYLIPPPEHKRHNHASKAFFKH